MNFSRRQKQTSQNKRKKMELVLSSGRTFSRPSPIFVVDGHFVMVNMFFQIGVELCAIDFHYRLMGIRNKQKTQLTRLETCTRREETHEISMLRVIRKGSGRERCTSEMLLVEKPVPRKMKTPLYSTWEIPAMSTATTPKHKIHFMQCSILTVSKSVM